MSILFPFLIASRLRQGTLGLEYDDTSEFKMPRVMNFTFEKVLDLERGLITTGVNFPFGGSLFLVAVKN